MRHIIVLVVGVLTIILNTPYMLPMFAGLLITTVNSRTKYLMLCGGCVATTILYVVLFFSTIYDTLPYMLTFYAISILAVRLPPHHVLTAENIPKLYARMWGRAVMWSGVPLTLLALLPLDYACGAITTLQSCVTPNPYLLIPVGAILVNYYAVGAVFHRMIKGQDV